MYSHYARPKWWQVYLTFPLLIALFTLDIRLKLSERGHQVVQIGIVLIVFGLIRLWLKANAGALAKMDQAQFLGGVTVLRIPQQRLAATSGPQRTSLQRPDSELKGILGDTFEMDYLDAEFIPMDKAVEDIKKE